MQYLKVVTHAYESNKKYLFDVEFPIFNKISLKLSALGSFDILYTHEIHVNTALSRSLMSMNAQILSFLFQIKVVFFYQESKCLRPFLRCLRQFFLAIF